MSLSLTDENIEKVKRLSFQSFYVENTDEHGLMGVAECLLVFSRTDINDICDELLLFIVHGLARKNLNNSILDFLNEYRSGKYNYKKSITSAIRFIDFSNHYIKLFSENFEDTPFAVGNVFMKEQVEICLTAQI